MYMQILTSTMDSHKETHKYAFELVKASRKMPVDRAEKQPHIQEIRKDYLQNLWDEELIKSLDREA